MDTYAPTIAAPPLHSPEANEVRPRSYAVPAALAGLIAAAAALRFASLGIQSYHHDEVITAMRVLPGSFGHMLHEVRVSESNPPLYYVLAWGWSQLFGLGEVGLRSLSALFGVAAGSLAAAFVVTDVMNLRFEWLAGPAIASALAALALTVAFGLAGTFTALGQKPARVLRHL